MEFVKSKGVIPMSSDYLKKDKERVENKLHTEVFSPEPNY